MKRIFIITLVLFVLTACSHDVAKISIKTEVPATEVPVAEVLITEAPITVAPSADEPVNAPEYPKIIIPTAERIETVFQSEGIFCIWTGEKFGFTDRDGRELTEYIYDAAYPFNEGVACVMTEGKYGFINKSGNEIIPAIYDRANSFSEGLAYFEAEGQYGFINKNGEEAFLLNCDSVSSFTEERALFSVDGKYGFIDYSGETVIDNVYDDAGVFKDGISVVRKGIKSGVIDKDGKEIVAVEYNRININQKYIIAHSNEEEVCFNFKGEKIFSSPLKFVNSNNDYIEFNDDGKFGVMDTNGSIITEAVYDDISFIENRNLFIVKKNEICGIINDKNEIVVDFLYKSINVPYVESDDASYVIIKNENKAGELRLSDFTVTLMTDYDHVNRLKNGWVIALSGGEYCLVDDKGEEVIPFGEYKYIYRTSDDLLCLKKNENEFYIASNNGEIISSKAYDSIHQNLKIGGFIIFESSGKAGLIDKTGKEVVKADYDYINWWSYRDNDFYIAGNFNKLKKDNLIIVGEQQEVDLTNILLTNEITPKLKPYHDLVKEYTVGSNPWGNEYAIKSVKLFHVDDFDEPILYYYDEPANPLGFPASNSAFYKMKNDAAEEIVRGNECGGSLRGDYVKLYAELETEKIVLGTRGSYGGGIHLENANFYHGDKALYKICYMEQFVHEYNDNKEYLLENAHLLYNNDVPFNRENIMEAEYIIKYMVNDELVTREEFHIIKGKYASLTMK